MACKQFPDHKRGVRWLCALLAVVSLGGCATAPPEPSGYAVFLLAGQSNMSGRGVGADSEAGLPADPRILAWEGRTVPARDPLAHQDMGAKPVAVGPGISFARAHLPRLPAGTSIVLVPAAYGGTGFSDAKGSWRVDTVAVSPLATTAAARANAAMRALGPGARFAGILWHQGETDGGNGMAAQRYQAELDRLIAYFRSNIDGAGPATPVLVGQYVPRHLADSAGNGKSTLAAIAATNERIGTRLAHAACVDSAGLTGNAPADLVHFDAASQRTLGRRYAAVLAALEEGRTTAGCGP